MGKSGGSQPTSQQVTTTSIPEYARPYVENTLGRSYALTTETPYQQYEGQRVAGFSPMQAQAFQNIAGQQTSPQLADASNMAYTSGIGALGYGQQAAGYGQQAANYGAQGANYGAEGAQYGALGAGIGLQGVGIGAQGMQAAQKVAGQAGGQAQQYGSQAVGAGDRYSAMATSPEQMQSYMSPYMQNVVDIEKREAARQADILRQQNQARAAQQGAFGGSRQAIVEAELQRNLMQGMGDIQTKGSQAAFEQARQAQQFGADIGLRGVQTGLQGVGQQIAAGQLGLAGAETGLRGIGMGLEGARTGIEGARTGISGAQTGISGAQTGISGAQAGISGAQAATGAAGQLGSLGAQQFEQQMGITDAMQKYGALQQAQQQAGLDVEYQNYLAAQNFPYQQIGYFSDLIRGLPLSQSSTSVYGGQPDRTAQIVGGITTAAAASRLKEGGQVKKYADGGPVAAEALSLEDVMGMRGKLRRLSDAQLAAYSRTVKDAITLSAIQTELDRRAKMRQPGAQAPESTTAEGIVKQAEAASIGRPRVGMAGGGIVALQPGGSPQDNPNYKEPGWLARTLSGGINNYLGEMGKAYAGPQTPPAPSAPPPAPPSPPVDIADGMAMEGPRGGPIQQSSDAPRADSGIALAGKRQDAPQSGSMTFEQFRQMGSQVEPNPETNALLADMQKRLESRFASAEDQAGKSKYEAIMLAGLAMMGGNSLADGIARAAQTGGAAYMASKKDAQKALNEAENAEIAFRKYQIELRNGNEKAAQEQFNNYQNYMLKLKQIDADYAKSAAIGGNTQFSKMETAARTLQGQIDRTASSIAGQPKYSVPLKAYEDKLKNNMATAADTAQYNQLIADLNAEIQQSTEGMRTRLGSLENQITGTSGFNVRQIK